MTQAVTGVQADDFIAALSLPAEALVAQRIPKKMLVDNGAVTGADKRLLQERIEEVIWVAALKPGNVGVAEYRDEHRAYLELAVLRVMLRERDGASDKVSRIAELVHRAIPYPVVQILEDDDNLHVSLAHIRWAQKEADKTVLDGELLHAAFHTLGLAVSEVAVENQVAFLASLSLSKQPRADLQSLYQGWMDTLSAWQVASVTGRFEVSATPQRAAERRAALQVCRGLDAQIAGLRSAASREKQMARQVALNLEIKALLAARQRAAASL